MKLTILGCGPSGGVPRIGNDWGVCDPSEPRNRRSRASILIEADDTRVLIDTGPDLRTQLLAANVTDVAAIIWTHDHADHCHGIDDVRPLFHGAKAAIPAYARPRTLEVLTSRFGYAFTGHDGYPAIVESQALPNRLQIGPIAVGVVDQPHGTISSAGLLFTAHGKSIGYTTDCHALTDDMRSLFARCDLWIVDALRRKPHPIHAHLDLALEWIETVQPARALLTHMDGSLDYAALSAELPAHIAPAYDGLEIIL